MVLAWLCFWFHREEKRRKEEKKKEKKEGIFKNNKQKQPSFSLQEAQKRKKKKRKKKKRKNDIALFSLFFFSFSSFLLGFFLTGTGARVRLGRVRPRCLARDRLGGNPKGTTNRFDVCEIKRRLFFLEIFFFRKIFLKSGVFHAPRSIVFLCGKTLSLWFLSFPPLFGKGEREKQERKKRKLVPMRGPQNRFSGEKEPKTTKKPRGGLGFSSAAARTSSSSRGRFEPAEGVSDPRRLAKTTGLSKEGERKKRNGKRKEKEEPKPLLFFFSPSQPFANPPATFGRNSPSRKASRPPKTRRKRKCFLGILFFPFLLKKGGKEGLLEHVFFYPSKKIDQNNH